MDRADVVAILGPPLRERPGNGGGQLLDYAINGAALWSFDFWIQFDAHGRVDIIHVEECPLVRDSYAICEVRPKLPVYEHPDFTRIVDGQK
jgi:hypothetical protein